MEIKQRLRAAAILAAVMLATGVPAPAQQSGSQQQSEVLLWPIAGTQTGEGIIARPQQYVGGQLNFGNLYIGAEYGTPVLAPADGTIDRPCVSVRWQTGMMSYRTDENLTWNGQIASVVEGGDYDVPDRCVTMGLAIRLPNGNKVWISGLNGDMVLKDGQKIHRGDTLGYVAYWEPSIEEPHIVLSMSHKNTTAMDPMTPFGLPTTFVEPKALVIPDSLTAEQAQEDFRALMDVLETEYPPLYDVVSPEIVIRRLTALVHDSHIGVMTSIETKDLKVANIFPGVLGDSLIVTRVMNGKGLERFVGRRIAAIDGRPAEEIINEVGKYKARGYDGSSESCRNYQMATVWNWYFDDSEVYNGTKEEAVIEFADGEVYRDRWISPQKATGYWPVPDINKMAHYSHLIRYKEHPYSFRMLNDSTVYFGLSSFQISKVDRDAVRDSIAAYIDVPYMVMDLRDNSGGDIYFTNELLSIFLTDSTRNLGGYSYVKTRGPLKHSLNYGPDQIVFPDYQPVEGKEGFYAPSENSRVLYPDSTLNYRGRLYILTDETSCSAASLFPSVLVRNRRAVTVGRETMTGYHYMTAMKYNEVRLPNSMIVLHIPLVLEVFDTAVTPRTPKGRGLMPDYPVPATYEEYFTAEEDFILNSALELIEQGLYLQEDYFAGIDTAEDSGYKAAWWIIGAVAAVTAAGAITISVIKRRQRQNKTKP